MTGDGREWLDAQPLRATAREQVTVALAMIDGIEAQIAPLDRELRAYAHRQAGCKALMAHYGIGPLVAVTILAELGDCTRFTSSGLRSATPAWTSRSISLISAARPGTSPDKGRRRCAGRCSRPPSQPAGRAARTATTTARRPGGLGTTAHACRSRASCSSAASTPCASSARRHSHPHDLPGARQALRHTDRRGRLPACSCPPPPGGRP